MVDTIPPAELLEIVKLLDPLPATDCADEPLFKVKVLALRSKLPPVKESVPVTVKFCDNLTAVDPVLAIVKLATVEGNPAPVT